MRDESLFKSEHLLLPLDVGAKRLLATTSMYYKKLKIMLDNAYFRRIVGVVANTKRITKRKITCFETPDTLDAMIKRLTRKHLMTKSELIRLALTRMEKGL